MARALGLTVLLCLFGPTMAGCATVCDDVAEEAEASGCAMALPEGDSELPACDGEREKRAGCLLEFSDNVCFLSDEEALAVQACMDGPA